jgi:hypothetical protein
MCLGVDHRYTTRADRQMVDVCLSMAGDPPIVEQPDRSSVEMLRQVSRAPDLPVRALPPNSCGHRLIDYARQQSAESAQAFSGMLLPASMATVILA